MTIRKETTMKSLYKAFGVTVFVYVLAVPPVYARDSGAKPILGMTTKDWSVDVVTEDLNYPWDVERAGDRLILTEAAGNIVIVQNGQLRRYPVRTSDPIVNEGGGGLLGMALSSDFQASGIAYFYHSYTSASGLTNKVIEARFDGSTWRETRVLLAGIPGHRLYNGGRIAIGPDGNLYVTTGWTENRERPQDRGNLAGKVLRMTLDGRVPADNPFAGSYVYSYGHRNPQGLTWNDEGDLFVAEHGQSAHDEINLVEPGTNYGWPLITGDQKRAGMETPWLQSEADTWAPSGIAFSGPELLVTALVGRGLYIFNEDTGALELVFTSGDRLRDVLPSGPDIYVITTNRSPRAEGPSDDRLLRLSPRR
jgi:glucose/arabinose dehydrogenase